MSDQKRFFPVKLPARMDKRLIVVLVLLVVLIVCSTITATVRGQTSVASSSKAEVPKVDGPSNSLPHLDQKVEEKSESFEKLSEQVRGLISFQNIQKQNLLNANQSVNSNPWMQFINTNHSLTLAENKLSRVEDSIGLIRESTEETRNRVSVLETSYNELWLFHRIQKQNLLDANQSEASNPWLQIAETVESLISAKSELSLLQDSARLTAMSANETANRVSILESSYKTCSEKAQTMEGSIKQLTSEFEAQKVQISKLQKDAYKGIKVLLYEAANYGGRWLDLDVLKCTSVLGDWNDKAASIQLTPDSCILIYEHNECSGRSVEIRKETPNLNTLSFMRALTSLGPCRPPLLKSP